LGLGEAGSEALDNRDAAAFLVVDNLYLIVEVVGAGSHHWLPGVRHVGIQREPLLPALKEGVRPVISGGV
jgi:hypothetical protein